MGIHDHNSDRDVIYRICAQRGWGVEVRDTLLQRAIDRVKCFDKLSADFLDSEHRYSPVSEQWCQNEFEKMEEPGALFGN